MTAKIAKGIVRKYGKGKDHLTVDDCTKVLHRRYAQMGNPIGGKKTATPSKNRSISGSRR